MLLERCQIGLIAAWFKIDFLPLGLQAQIPTAHTSNMVLV